MPSGSLKSLKIKAKLLQKAKSAAGKPIALKLALQKIAKLAGFDSWQDLKRSSEATDHFCPPGASAIWKAWYASYEEALPNFDPRSHYLLPYRRQFFVCDIHWIEFLGIGATDPDLALVGHDWVHPKDLAAFDRLVAKIKK